MHQIFVCHAHEDYASGLGASAKFEAAGIGCWIAPRNVGPGAYADQLVQAISEAAIVLLLFSEKANRSEHVMRELEIASNRKKTIVPVRIEDVQPSPGLEYFTSRIQWFDAIAPSFEARLDALMQFVRPLLGAQAVAAPAGVKSGVPAERPATTTYAFTDGIDLSPSGLVQYDEVIRAAVVQHAGELFRAAGTTYGAAFVRPEEAVAAVLDIQRALAAENVRAAIHTGSVDRVTSMLEIAHGGQVLVSGVTHDLALGELPAQVGFKDLGAHRLRDLSRPEQVYQVVAPGLRSDFPPLRSLGTLPNNLPMELKSFVGRDREIAEVTALLSQHRLVTLAGSGGVGKSRLSLQVAANVLDGSGDGVWFIELAPLSDGLLIPSTIAAILGLALAPQKDPVTALVDAIGTKSMLLVFDNCEHLVDASANVIAALLRSTPKVVVLASSRQSLGVSGEETYRMPSLSMPSEEESAGLRAERARDFGAMTLFVDRAVSADKRFELTDDNAPVVAEIVRRLDGIPLAIELAAPRVKMLDVRQLSKRLDERFRLLTGGGRDVLPRQQTLRALIDWSYDLLDEREKTLFARLGIFVDGFTLEAATAVCTDDNLDDLDLFDLLSSLVDKSLVSSELIGGAARYQLLESTRAYALEKLDAIGDHRRMADRHLDWVVAITTQATEINRTRLRFVELEALVLEKGNIRSAIAWAEQSKRYDAAAAIAIAVGSKATSGFGGREWLERTRTIIELIPATENATLARLWSVHSVTSGILRRLSESFESGEKGLEAARRSGDAGLIATSLIDVASSFNSFEKFDESERLLDEVAVGLSDLDARSRYLYHLSRGVLSLMRGNFEAASREYTTIIDQWRALGAPLERYSSVYHNLAEIEYGVGNVERAIEIVRDVLRSARSDSSATISSINLAAYLIAVDRLDEARGVVGQAFLLLPIESELSAYLLESMALAVAIGGETARAARLLGFSSVVMDAPGMREYTERTGHERLRALLAEAHTAEELAQLAEEGRAYTWQQARDEAMRRS